MLLNLKTHFWYYLSLIVIDTLGLILTAFLAYDHRMQLLVVIIMNILATSWALVHHYLEHDLHPKIVIEYVLFGTLGIAIAFFLIR
jgi:hypothetical protein